MTVEGVRKLTVASAGVGAELTLALKAEPNKLSFFVAVSITVITLVAIAAQAFLDHRRQATGKT